MLNVKLFHKVLLTDWLTDWLTEQIIEMLLHLIIFVERHERQWEIMRDVERHWDIERHWCFWYNDWWTFYLQKVLLTQNFHNGYWLTEWVTEEIIEMLSHLKMRLPTYWLVSRSLHLLYWSLYLFSLWNSELEKESMVN